MKILGARGALGPVAPWGRGPVGPWRMGSRDPWAELGPIMYAIGIGIECIPALVCISDSTSASWCCCETSPLTLIPKGSCLIPLDSCLRFFPLCLPFPPFLSPPLLPAPRPHILSSPLFSYPLLSYFILSLAAGVRRACEKLFEENCPRVLDNCVRGNF